MRTAPAPASIGKSSIVAILILIIALLDIEASLGFSAAPSPPRVKDTKVAVDGRATVAVVPPPQNSRTLSNAVSLSSYMRLPVEQYVLIPMPLGSSLTTSTRDVRSRTTEETTEFELVVPTITFFKLSLTPVVYATVRPQEDRVVISSSECVLRGSPFIEKVKLNDRFDFTVDTTLTWEDALSETNAGQRLDSNFDDNSMGCSITAETRISVDVDVPRPFSAIPRRVLEQTGNAAMRVSLKYIQANFVENLARDYDRWATDSEYRSYRASLSEEVVVEEDDVLVGAGDAS